jgi:hypothetical protein
VSLKLDPDLIEHCWKDSKHICGKQKKKIRNELRIKKSTKKEVFLAL